MELVFSDTPARLAVQVESRLHDPIAVIAHQTTTIGRYPEEPVGVHEDIADMVMGQAVAQIQRGQVIAVCQEVAGMDYRGVRSEECGVRNDFEEREEGSEE
jgi:hypothetical protein